MVKRRIFHTLAALLIAVLAPVCAGADTVATVCYRAEVLANASSGRFAPYMIGSWNYGKITEKAGLWHNGLVFKPLDTHSRFGLGAGVEYMLGAGTSASYQRYNQASGDWTHSRAGQAHARIQQLYGQIKYRGAYLLAGMKERTSGIVDGRLSSGDLVRSNNARPIPGVTAGFIDFQNIPFTRGWVQIDGEVMYGRFADTRFEEKRFNYFSGYLDGDLMYTYKRCYFRTNPAQPLSVTVGMQTAGVFGGYTHSYRAGKLQYSQYRGFKFKDVFKMFFPIEGNGDDFYTGNSLGSWDFKANIRLRGGSRLSAYFEWPWEDGSGIGRRNGWDGLWGLQLDFAPGAPVQSLVLEYIDFTNQSGPIHWAPGDDAGTDITTGITGGDNYYNNNYYGAYANYGMAIGTPFIVAPLYNRNGFLEFMHNRARGFHAAAAGTAGQIAYRAMLSYQKAGGMGRVPAPKLLHNTSAMFEASWQPMLGIRGMCIKAAIALDWGNLRGKNLGTIASISYSGDFSLKK